jgi:hypothetical protein
VRHERPALLVTDAQSLLRRQAIDLALDREQRVAVHLVIPHHLVPQLDCPETRRETETEIPPASIAVVD